MNTNLRRIALILVLTPLVTAPSVSDAAGYVSIHVGAEGAGLAVGTTDWAVYGASWYDPNWSLSFDTHLAGYGEWIQVDGIGRVWRPWVASGWRPFTYGRWVDTTMGWTWIAYEPWGYVPHHYGNWAMTTFGWVWVPGWTYRPATVSWMSCGSYVGWYPTPPRGWVQYHRVHGRGWNNGYRSGYDRGYDDGWRDARYATWVPWGRLGDDNLSRHATDYRSISRARTASPHSISAPDHATAVRRGATVPRASLEERTVDVGNRRVTVARPSGYGAADIASHGQSTVRTALSPRAKGSDRGVARSPRQARGSEGRSTTRTGFESSRLGSRTTADRPARIGSTPSRATPSRTERRGVTGAGRSKFDATSNRTRQTAAPRSPGNDGREFGSVSRQRSKGSPAFTGQQHGETQNRRNLRPTSANRGQSAQRARPAIQPSPQSTSGRAVTRIDARQTKPGKASETKDRSRSGNERRRSRPSGK